MSTVVLSRDSRTSAGIPLLTTIGVFATLAVIARVLADGAQLDGLANTVASGATWVAAILVPAGFFLSSAGRGATQPNRLIALVYAGTASLTAGVVALGGGPAGA